MSVPKNVENGLDRLLTQLRYCYFIKRNKKTNKPYSCFCKVCVIGQKFCTLINDLWTLVTHELYLISFLLIKKVQQYCIFSDTQVNKSHYKINHQLKVMNFT